MSGYKKQILYVFLIQLLLSSLGFSSFSQPKLITGIVRDYNSLKPVTNVNIKINSTNEGVSTGRDGRFSLTIKRIPASLTISCVGYEQLYYNIDKLPAKPIELILRPYTSTLPEVDIKAVRFKYVFRDLNYSVLDYEIMDDKLLLLIFRYQLKRSELILLNMNGDTVSIAPVPEQKPKCFYKDFTGNVHYVSTQGNAFQIYYNVDREKFEFPYVSVYEELSAFLKPFLFRTDSRIYFQEFAPDGLGENFGYYDTLHHKRYIHIVQDDRARSSYSDDVQFNDDWNAALQKNQEALTGPGVAVLSKIKPSQNTSYLPVIDEIDIQANKFLNYKIINVPIRKLSENEIAIFNFPESDIEFMNKEGKIYRSVPIDFHKETEVSFLGGLAGIFVPNADWEWSGKIYIDEYFRDVYTTFVKNGMVQIRKIDLQTGKITRICDVPFPFPEKIKLYKGDAYFLMKDVGGTLEKWKLVKLSMQ
jgi:hypothetical protein